MIILSIVLLGVGIFSTAYFIMYMFMVDLNNLFTFFWLVLGIAGIAGGVLLIWLHRHQIAVPVWLSRGGLTVMGLFLLLFLVVEGIIIGYGHSKPISDAEYVIVLGARVRGEHVTYTLCQRLNVACDYLKKNPSTKVILSGGQGAGEDISEAEAMKRYLGKKGIEEERMILEDQSVNTEQNMAFSIEKMRSTDASAVIVTNYFHVYRAVHIAKKKGMTRVEGAGAPVKWYTVPNLYVREAFAVIKYAVFGQI